MSPAWMRPFPRHLGRVRSIQIAVAGYPCLDECHEGTAAGIYAIRRLKFKRYGELALRLSLRLTFAWGCVAVRAIHLTLNMPRQIRVAVPRLPGGAKTRGPARHTRPTGICGSVSTVRFARSGRISFRLMAQRLEVSVDNMARESWMYYRHSNSK